jgi:hypothetical protein
VRLELRNPDVEPTVIVHIGNGKRARLGDGVVAPGTEISA